MIRSVDIDQKPVTVIAANSDVGVLYGAFHFLRLVQTRQTLDCARHRLEAAHADSRAQSLGQPRPSRRTRLCRAVDLGLAQAAGIPRSALHRLRARLRVDRHQRRGADQRECERHQPHAGISREGCGARRRLAAVWRARLSHRAVQRAHRARRIEDRRSARSAVRAWWKAKIDEIYAPHPGLRRFPRQGELRRPARAAGLQAHARRRREHARRGRWRHMAASSSGAHSSIRTKRPTIAPSRPTTSSCRSTASSRDNVLVQVKNGAIDFQPREPFHPLFGAMPKTPLMMEFQITKEYLGFATHLAYLGTAVRRGARLGHEGEGQGFDGGEGRRRRTARLPRDRHGRRVQHRRRSQLDRLAFRPGQLVRLRAPCLGSRTVIASHRRRMGAHDVQQRSGIRRRPWWR